MYGHKKKDRIYQLSDYYSIFYFKYIKDNFGKDEHFWSNTNDNPSRRAWEGLTFEQICKDHVNQIKKKLGISGVLTEISSWTKQGNDDEEGAQIDMLIDRRDRVINLCEIKFSALPYEIDKGCDASLKKKVSIFREDSKTNKTIIVTMITTYGIKKNKYSNYVGKEVSMDDLFERI